MPDEERHHSHRRILAVLVSVLVATTGILVVATPASARPRAVAITGAVDSGALVLPAEPAVFCAPGDSECDADRDRIPDDVEEAVCGSATCATGREDTDGDGLPDWVEFQATRSLTKADPRADKDGDGIPDFAERIACGTEKCSTGREDIDGDGVADWAEIVICGDSTCADGTEDYDGDGVADAKQLAACVVYGRGDGWLASTGAQVMLAVVAALLLVAGGLAARAWAARRRLATAGIAESADDGARENQ